MDNRRFDPLALHYITVKQHRSFEYNDLTFIVTFASAVPYPKCGKRKAGYWTGGGSKKEHLRLKETRIKKKKQFARKPGCKRKHSNKYIAS